MDTAAGRYARTVIIGNAGAGKSWLAARMRDALSLPVTNLDDIHWLPGGYAEKRDRNEAIRMAEEAAAGEGWIIEGVHGWLVAPILDRATCLVWLDRPWPDCRRNIEARHVATAGGPDQSGLMAWAKAYWMRQTPSSHEGHRRIFVNFSGGKHQLATTAEIGNFVRLHAG